MDPATRAVIVNKMAATKGKPILIIFAIACWAVNKFTTAILSGQKSTSVSVNISCEERAFARSGPIKKATKSQLKLIFVCEFIMFEYVSRNKLLSLCLENLTRLAGLTRVTRLTGFAGYTEIYIMVSG